MIGMAALTFSSCQKELEPVAEPPLEQASKAGVHGHLQQTKTFSDEVVLKWMDFHLRMLQTTSPESARRMAYIGVALYESVVPGMPAYRSLGGQLNELPELPGTNPGLAYHWAASANAALASTIRGFYTTATTALKASMDSLEAALNSQYAGEVPVTTLERSTAFGKAVASAILQWAATDGNSTIYPPYVPLGPGYWAPNFPTFAPAATPYLGRNRTTVKGSLEGTAPEAPPVYSENPSSAYYQMVKEVYDVSQTLTVQQRQMAVYYRDVPGFGGGGSHYISVLSQLLQATNPQLDEAAVAYAKTGMAIYDAQIGCWQEKYKYNIDRPIRYIRDVLGHKEWLPVFNTPAHPDYPSGHSTLAGAVEVVFNNVFGADYQFTNHAYDFLGMPPQHYADWADMAVQIGQSRVYAGIHYTLSCVNGREQGNKIARNQERLVQFKK